MSRARDLADSADKDIVGTLTLDGLSVDGDVGIGTSSPSTLLPLGCFIRRTCSTVWFWYV